MLTQSLVTADITADYMMMVVTCPDGCRFDMNPHDGHPEGWKLDLPGGFIITCPHGLVVRMVFSTTEDNHG